MIPVPFASLQYGDLFHIPAKEEDFAYYDSSKYVYMKVCDYDHDSRCMAICVYGKGVGDYIGAGITTNMESDNRVIPINKLVLVQLLVTEAINGK